MPDLSLNRRQTLAGLAASVALPIVIGGGRAFAAPGKPATEAQAAALLNSIGDNLATLKPEDATSAGIDTGHLAKLRSMLRDRTPAGQNHIRDVVAADLARANAVNVSALSHSTRTSIEVVRSAYTTALEGFAQPYGDVAVGDYRNTPYVIIQNVGAYLDVPKTLDGDHPIKNAADAEAYMARLESYPRQLDGELERARAARAMGLVPPNFLVDKALKQLRSYADNARKGGTLVESIERRTKEQAIAGNWAERARSITQQKVTPALERQIAELEAERAVAKDSAGMWAQPHGDEYYRWALKASTTTTMTPDEVHRMGLEQLKELHGRMDPILKSLGYTKGSVGARMQALGKDPRYLFSEGDKGRDEIKAFIQQSLAKIRTKLPQAFNTLVPGRVEVWRLPPEEEPGAPGAYGQTGSRDGTIPGKFWINLHTTALHNKFNLTDLTMHEAIPGHIWQGEYASKLPPIRTLLAFNAYSEGWALYAEQIADELGIYDDFPPGRLGYLQSLAFRACRLVVDTGIHAKRWTREQGVNFFVVQNGDNPIEVASEVDRYCSWPGQACGYKVGHTTINRLRDKAKAQLGARYDLRAFDDAVVLGGNVPMDVLAKNVDEYIRTAKAKA